MYVANTQVKRAGDLYLESYDMPADPGMRVLWRACAVKIRGFWAVDELTRLERQTHTRLIHIHMICTYYTYIHAYICIHTYMHTYVHDGTGLVSAGFAYMICSTLVAFVCYTLGLHLRRLGGEGASPRREGASVQRARAQGPVHAFSPEAALGSGMNGAQDTNGMNAAETDTVPANGAQDTVPANAAHDTVPSQNEVPLGSVTLHVEPVAMYEGTAACMVVLRDVDLFVPSASASAPGEKGASGHGTGCETGGCRPASSSGQMRLLHNISAVFEPGSITALMGASGAGKTSLLNLIACRIHMNSPGARVEGLVSCLVQASSPAAPAQRVDGMAFSHMCGYVEQEPTLFPLMTVREALAFSARLRLAGSMSPAQRAAVVDSVVDLMELHSVLDLVFIKCRAGAGSGSPAACPLGAEVLKLVCIAVELVANPSILLMDEPTSG